ncbi:protein NEN1-like [Pistacia vera]|uniref:protein NEN1-like n=1 Tax=Pistacia vera TaxID=55513 RepID=UPI0012630C83|nr:protein NEN1-like [Pistacia vera]
MKPSIAAMGTPADRSEIAFFDLETTFSTPDQPHTILEFGAILVCPKKLKELDHYSTLVRPTDPSLISSFSARRNGITPDAINSAPTFAEIADTVFDILHGRIWAGHNIVKFDCEIIKEAFAEVGQAPPEPKETIDTWALLTQRFGRRAGDMKMATLAEYFELGQQTHRSLDDVRMNLEVLKHCATVLFLVLDACDSAAQKLSMDSGSSSEWQPVVTRKNCFYNYPTARLRIPTTVSGDVTRYDTEICQKGPSGTVQKLASVKFDAAELDSLFKQGTFVDAFLSVDPYDYQQSAGIRLVAKKLIIHPE